MNIKYDVHITDIAPQDLPTKVSEAMGIAYLSLSMSPFRWPLFGKLYGRNKRILFTIPVTGRGKSLNVHFIFDTGAPTTFIAPSVLDALGIPEVSIYSEVVRFNGVAFDQFFISHNKEQLRNIAGLNLLGMDLLQCLQCKMELDFHEKVFTLVRQDG